MIVRVCWGLIAVVAAAVVIGASTDTVGSTDLGCSKTGSTGVDDLACSDPITTQVGAWPFVVMGAAMTGPSVLALLVGRAWTSWVAVVVLLAVGVWGLAHWTSVWVTLVLAVPFAIVGLVVAAVQTALSFRASP